MKFYIWGAGKLGHLALDFLGYLRVEGFIDNNLKGEIQQKPIISYRDFSKTYLGESNIIVVVASSHYSKEMVSLLKKDGFTQYFVFDENDPFQIFDFMPFSIIYRKRINTTYTQMLYHYDLNKCKVISIYGINSYLHYLIAEIWFQNENIEINIIGNKDNVKYSMGCRFLQFDEAYTISDYVILNVKIEDDDIRFKLLAEKYDTNKIIDLFNNDQFIDCFNYKKIKTLKNLCLGKRVFIIGNGPSLKIEDLQTLEENNEFCIGSNRIYKVFNKTKWRPNVLALSDGSIIANTRDDIKKYEGILVKTDHFHRNTMCIYENNAIYIHLIENEYGCNHPQFCEDISKGAYWGYTVTYDICIQLAYYMGAKEIYLVGIDHSFYGNTSSKENHFIENYFDEDDQKIFMKRKFNTEKATRAYETAKIFLENHGVKIYNATRGGKLEVFERVSLDDILKQNVK